VPPIPRRWKSEPELPAQPYPTLDRRCRNHEPTGAAEVSSEQRPPRESRVRCDRLAVLRDDRFGGSALVRRATRLATEQALVALRQGRVESREGARRVDRTGTSAFVAEGASRATTSPRSPSCSKPARSSRSPRTTAFPAAQPRRLCTLRARRPPSKERARRRRYCSPWRSGRLDAPAGQTRARAQKRNSRHGLSI